MKQITTSVFSSDIGKFLWFKGWTLAYFLHWLDRFSTDIDIDLLDMSQEELIIQRIEEIVIMFGDIKNITLGKSLHRWILSYEEREMNIKVELNKKIWQSNKYEQKDLFWTWNITCMTEEILFTNKIVALSERFANRDLYDTYFFFKKWIWLCQLLITERTGLDLPSFCKKLIKILPEKYKENTILHNLWEVLTDKQKARVKAHLLDEVLGILNKKFLEITETNK